MVANALRAAAKRMRNGESARATGILRALAKRPRSSAVVQLALARAAMAAGEHESAQEAINAARLRIPRNSRLLCRLIAAQISIGDIPAAKERLAWVRKLYPDAWQVWMLSGALSLTESDTGEAISCFERQMQLAPTPQSQANALLHMADCYEAMAKADEAATSYRRVVAVDPSRAGAYFHLVNCDQDLNARDGITLAITKLLESPHLEELEKRHLHYALGHLYKRADEPGLAFSHFRHANHLRARLNPWNPKPFRQAVLARPKIFTQEFIESLGASGCQDESFVCIVGMPRSGTTLVEQILCSHSLVRGLGERGDVYHLARLLPRELASKQRYPWCARQLTTDVVFNLSHAFAQQRMREAGDSARIVTKRPEDFWDLGLIRILLPKARIIHCRRHPIDTCLSCYMQDFADIPYATDLDALAEVYRHYLRIMNHWNEVLPASAILDINYEELVTEPESAVRRLCEFCGLQFEPSCLQFHQNKKRVETASRWQVRRPLYQSSVDRWKRYRDYLGPLLELDERSTVAQKCDNLGKREAALVPSPCVGVGGG